MPAYLWKWNLDLQLQSRFVTTKHSVSYQMFIYTYYSSHSVLKDRNLAFHFAYTVQNWRNFKITSELQLMYRKYCYYTLYIRS
jgi:hypothetical protein